MHLEQSLKLGAALRDIFDPRALKFNRRILLHFKKIGALQMLVAAFDSGVDRRGLDRELDLGRMQVSNGDGLCLFG